MMHFTEKERIFFVVMIPRTDNVNAVKMLRIVLQHAHHFMFSASLRKPINS
jgi:hypothetical protein